ncbi:MAG: hypothetical protein ABIE70_03630 [bacterium]
MKRTVYLTAMAVVAVAPSTMAANLAVIATPPGIVNFLILGAAVAGVIGSFRVREMLRGGILSQSWLLFCGGFAAMALAQVLQLTTDLQILQMPSLVISLLWAAMVGLFLGAIFVTKRHLS